jgi:hypothetical protein
LSNAVDDLRKVFTYGDHPHEAYAGRTWTGVGSICVVLVRFFPAGCTSDMSNRLFVAVIMWIITELDGLMLLMVYGYAYCDIPPLSRDGQS